MANKTITKESLEEHNQKAYENSRDSTESMKKHTSYLVTQLDKYPSLENREVIREDLKRLEKEANRSYRYDLGDIRHNYGASENTSRTHYEAKRDYDNKMSYVKVVGDKISQQLEGKLVGGLKDEVYRVLREEENEKKYAPKNEPVKQYLPQTAYFCGVTWTDEQWEAREKRRQREREKEAKDWRDFQKWKKENRR